VKVALRRGTVVVLALFIFVFLWSIFIYPGRGSIIQLINPIFIGAVIGLILLFGVNKKLW